MQPLPPTKHEKTCAEKEGGDLKERYESRFFSSFVRLVMMAVRSLALPASVACFVPRRAKPTSLDRGWLQWRRWWCWNRYSRYTESGHRTTTKRRRMSRAESERRLSCDSFLANTHTRNDDATVRPSGRDEMRTRWCTTEPQFLACDAVELGAESRMSSVTFRTLKRFLGA